MKSRASLRFAILAAALAVLPTTSHAQVEASKPIQVKAPKSRIKILKFNGEVVHANLAQITVRDRRNPMVIRTFTLTPEVQQQMEKIISKGGYQYGDRVEIHHEAGRQVATRIKGKPSKPR